MGFALAAGIWANAATESRLRLEWERSHGPGPRVWRRALEAEAFRELTHEASYRRAVRTLPSLAEPPGSVWRSADGRWLAVFPHEAEETAPLVFGFQGVLGRIERGLVSRRTGRPLKSVPAVLAGEFPAAWVPAGSGWPAFEEALAQASAVRGREPLAAPAPSVRKRPLPAGDPREFKY